MPPTRRSTRASSGQGRQSTLSFKHRVTKSIQAGKKGYESPSRAKEYVPEPSPPELPSPAGAAAGPEAEEAEEQEEEVNRIGNDKDGDGKTEEEREAEKIADAAIERYWAAIEASRLAKEVHRKHTEGLTTAEKVLRYFDVSSHYGVRLLSFFFRFSVVQWLMCGPLIVPVCVPALRWHYPDEALAAGKEAGLEPAHRGARCAPEGGGEGECGH